MTSTATPAIKTLLEIMSNDEVSTRRRIEACEGLLAYEAPAETVAEAREYLVRVFEDTEEILADRMDALKLARKFESPKIALPTVSAVRNETDRRERWRVYETWLLRREIIIETRDLPPEGWDAHLLSDDYEPPEGTEMPPLDIEDRPGHGYVVHDYWKLLPDPNRPRRRNSDD